MQNTNNFNFQIATPCFFEKNEKLVDYIKTRAAKTAISFVEAKMRHFTEKGYYEGEIFVSIILEYISIETNKFYFDFTTKVSSTHSEVKTRYNRNFVEFSNDELTKEENSFFALFKSELDLFRNKEQEDLLLKKQKREEEARVKFQQKEELKLAEKNQIEERINFIKNWILENGSEVAKLHLKYNFNYFKFFDTQFHKSIEILKDLRVFNKEYYSNLKNLDNTDDYYLDSSSIKLFDELKNENGIITDVAIKYNDEDEDIEYYICVEIEPIKGHFIHLFKKISGSDINAY